MYVGVNSSGEIQGLWLTLPLEPHSAVMLALPGPVENSNQIEIVMEDRWPLPPVPVSAQLYPNLTIAMSKKALAVGEEVTATASGSTEAEVYFRVISGDTSTGYVAASVTGGQAEQAFSFETAGEYLIEAYSPKHGRAETAVTVT